MKNSLLLIALLTICVFLGACRKNTPQTPPASGLFTPPAPTPGTPGNTNPANAAITGRIAPLSVAQTVSVKVTNMDNGKAYPTKPDDKGVFTVSGLPGGTYMVTVEFASSPVKINLPPVAINGVQTKDMQTITLEGIGGYVINGTSTISGTIIPAGGSNSAYAYHKQSLRQYPGIIDANGKFVIKDLPEGPYYIIVNPATNFTGTAFTPTEINLSINQTADVGSFTFIDNTDPTTVNYLSYELDGVKKFKDVNNKAFYALPKFGLYTYTTASVYLSAIDMYRSTVADRLDIALDGITGPGTYACNGTASSIKVTHREIINKPGPMGSSRRVAGALTIWSTTGTGGSGTITITVVDKVNKTISGTFTAVVVPESGANGSRVITKGAFTNYKYAESPF